MVGVDNALNLHMNTYFWELQGGGNLFFFAATPVGALIGTALASPLTRWFDKKPSVIIGTLCWALCPGDSRCASVAWMVSAEWDQRAAVQLDRH